MMLIMLAGAHVLHLKIVKETRISEYQFCK